MFFEKTLNSKLRVEMTLKFSTTCLLEQFFRKWPFSEKYAARKVLYDREFIITISFKVGWEDVFGLDELFLWNRLGRQAWRHNPVIH